MAYYYENTLDLFLPKELWKDVTDYEGYYQVSNFGRVKSLDRQIPHPRLKSQFIKGRILKQKVVEGINLVSDAKMVALQVALCRENSMHFFNVRRLVYAAYKRPIDFKKDGLYVINKNYNGYNNTIDNLELVTKEEKSKRAFKRGRVPESHLKKADRSKWVNKIYAGKASRKPIAQIDPENKLPTVIYKSVREASQKTGFDSKGIINSAKGRQKLCCGFKWEYITSKKTLE